MTGSTLGSYRVLDLLGRGGMGEVYRAHDAALGRDVALKVVSPDAAADPEFVARFEREARAASAVGHPNVAQIHALGRHDERPYYVMEFVEGASLQSLMHSQGSIPGARVLGYLIQACHGLAAALEKGVIHRDLKPANLMIDSKDNLKIVDFGLARRLASDDASLTHTGQVMGTPRYMAPEQALGRVVDHRADIYSLGATFYHVLAGRPPYDATTPVAVLMKHVSSPLPPLHERNPLLPAAFCRIVERMLAKDPADRYPGYERLIEDLSALQRNWQADPTGPTVPHARPTSESTTAEGSSGMPGRTAEQWETPRTGSQEAMSQTATRLERTSRILVGVVVVALFVAVAALGAALWAILGKQDGTATATGDARSPKAASAAPAASLTPAPTPPKVAPEKTPTPSFHAAETPVAIAAPSVTSRPALPPAPLPGPPAASRPPAPSSPSPLPAGADVGGGRLFPFAPKARTLMQMHKICRALGAYKKAHGKLPERPDELTAYQPTGLGLRFDAWGSELDFDRLASESYRLTSFGPDKKAGTEDDIVFENGILVKGGSPPPAGAPAPGPRREPGPPVRRPPS